jgi:hypothetical protein
MASTPMSTPSGPCRRWSTCPGSRPPSRWSSPTPVSRPVPAPTRSTRRTSGSSTHRAGAIAVQARLGPPLPRPRRPLTRPRRSSSPIRLRRGRPGPERALTHGVA